MTQAPPATLLQNLLVHTKLRRPRTVGQIVRRPRLVDLLNRGMSRPLTIVSAPAGYGKTTVVGLWLNELAVPWAWYSVDEQDDSLDIFAAYLATAVASAYPGCGATLQAVLQNPTLPRPQRLADIFVGELAALPGELLIVLDDFHAVAAPDIHEFLAFVVQNIPEGVHLVLLVRADPPLKLARLRARQQVHELRAAQLRFTDDEARELMHRIMGDLATDETVALFAQRTEGWAAGLHLAATSMRDSDNAAAFAMDFARSSSRAVADFLVSEVLEHLAPEERDLLLRTSILSRFCAPLCDAMLANARQEYTGAIFLDRLRGINAFLVALDEDGTWYRFHHLFADILRHHLRQTLDEAEVCALHGAASRWFETQGLVDEAIVHALQAGDPPRAAQLVEKYTESLLNGENWRTLERWLALLPEAQKRRPALLAALGWVEQFRYRPSSILTLVQEAEAGLECNDAHYTAAEVEAIRSTILTLRAVASTYVGRWAATRHFAEQALPTLAIERAFVRGICELSYLRALLRLGYVDDVLRQAQKWLLEQETRATTRTLRLRLALCSSYYDLLQLDELHAAATAYRHLALQARRPVSVAWATYSLGFVHYQRNEPVLAQIHFAQIVQYPHEAHTRTVVDSWIGLCLSLGARGMYREAQEQVAELHSFLLQGGQVEFTPTAEALAVFLQLQAGEPVRVRDSFCQNLPGQIGLDFLLIPLLVWGMAAIRTGGREQLAAVGAKLAEYRTLLADNFVPRRLLELELLEALLYAAQGQHKAALDAVRRAVELLEPGGALRSFADCGTELKPYLHQLADMGIATRFIGRILAAYAPVAGEARDATPPAAPLVLAPADQSVDLGPDQLTNRELDVLLLLDRRLSNKEIGELLYISPSTVKRHTVSIYSKLQVDNRRSAVARAKALGLMPIA